MIQVVDDPNYTTGARLECAGGRWWRHVRLHDRRLTTQRLGTPALVARRSIPHAVLFTVAGRLCGKSNTTIVLRVIAKQNRLKWFQYSLNGILLNNW